MTDNSTRLYRINIDSNASPAEVQHFCELLENYDYVVVTDLSSGTMEIHEQDGDER